MSDAPAPLAHGIHADVPAHRYHADPAPAPSLSASIADLIVDRSPLHAWDAHPRLNPEFRSREPTDEMVDGTILHAMMSDETLNLAVINAPDRRAKAWKDAAPVAFIEGKTPILKRTYDNLVLCANAARSQIMEFSEALLPPGLHEAVAICDIGDGYYRRLRIDHLPNDPTLPIADFKFTTKNGAPMEWERTIIKEHALRAAFYSDTLHRVRGAAPAEYRFIVVETTRPYAVSVMAPGPKLLDIGRRRVEYAQRWWNHGMETGKWPAYPDRVCYVEAPYWAVKNEDSRDERAMIADAEAA